MTFRWFTDCLKELVTTLVPDVGENDLVPMVHVVGPDREATGWVARTGVGRTALAVVGEYQPAIVGLTFHGRRGRVDGFFEHEVATVVVIDRERVEVWEARLVRHDDTASLGAWRRWPIDAAAGTLVNPIQKAMRQ